MPAQFFYRNKIGRCLLKPVVSPAISKAAGVFLDSGISRILIGPFVRKNRIDLSDVSERTWGSFNAFFTRRLRAGARPVDASRDALVAPCDGLLTAVPVADDAVFSVKGICYTLSELLQDGSLAREFSGGWCLIFRLTPAHYHRYCFVDAGSFVHTRKIPGVFHTVRPIALENAPVFRVNTREYAVLDAARLGRIVQMEVGATLVGRIVNHKRTGSFLLGEEKGMFEFGGSTVILLLRAGIIAPEGESKGHTGEIPVRLGQRIGKIQALPSSV